MLLYSVLFIHIYLINYDIYSWHCVWFMIYCIPHMNVLRGGGGGYYGLVVFTPPGPQILHR